MSKSYEVAKRALMNQVGAAQDNLHRARNAFAGASSKDLDSPYGHGQSTPRQILAEYEAAENEARDALAWLERVGGSE